MRLTDPEVIQHLEEGYYITRESWSKGRGYWWCRKSGVQYVCWPMEWAAGGFSLGDLKADDWILCPKEESL